MSTGEVDAVTDEAAVPGLDFQSLLDSDVDGLLDVAEKPKKVTSNDRLERAFWRS
ncbi:hypothetical protein GCM10020255_007750 [Rhodococcus baikonurensis]